MERHTACYLLLHPRGNTTGIHAPSNIFLAAYRSVYIPPLSWETLKVAVFPSNPNTTDFLKVRHVIRVSLLNFFNTKPFLNIWKISKEKNECNPDNLARFIRR
jgi:hypothetical protein